MNTKRLVKTKGIVLSEANFSEFDKMLTILTPDLGKISCVAKGARKMQSGLLAPAQIFAFSEMILYKGNGENYYINSAELIEPFYSIRNDYEGLTCAMECIKFIKQYVQENQTSVSMLKLLLNTIYLISIGEKNNKFIENVFKFKATCLMGFKPDFGRCIGCGSNELTGFSIKKSGAVCRGCGIVDKSVIQLSKGTVATIDYIAKSDLKKLFSFNINEEILDEFQLFNRIYLKDKLN